MMDGGTITAAIIFGAIISLVTMIVGRGMKISELRQAWINDQRADFGKWAAAALAIARQESPSTRAADFALLDETAFRIRLRENPTKGEWKDVIEEMDRVRAKLVANSGGKPDIYDHLVSIANASQRRLKADWNKVKYGETGYRVMLGALAVLVAGFFWLMFSELKEAPAKAEVSRIEQHLAGEIRLVPPPVPPRSASDVASPAVKQPALVAPK